MPSKTTPIPGIFKTFRVFYFRTTVLIPLAQFCRRAVSSSRPTAIVIFLVNFHAIETGIFHVATVLPHIVWNHRPTGRTAGPVFGPASSSPSMPNKKCSPVRPGSKSPDSRPRDEPIKIRKAFVMSVKPGTKSASAGDPIQFVHAWKRPY